MKKLRVKKLRREFIAGARDAVSSPGVWIITGLNAVAGYIDGGGVSGAFNRSSRALGGMVIGQGVVNTIVEEVFEED